MIRVFPLIVAMALAAGCAGPKLPQPRGQTSGLADYPLDSGDRLKIVVFGEPDLSGEQKVNEDGDIVMPLIGALPARGSTAAQLARTIGAKVSHNTFGMQPPADVRVVEWRPVIVARGARHLGPRRYVAGMTAGEAIEAAGGARPGVEASRISLARKTFGAPRQGVVSPDTPLMPGDVIALGP